MQKQDFLEVGQVFELKEGMTVYAEVEKRFIYSNLPLSKEKAQTNLKVGSVLDTGSGAELKTDKFKGNYVVLDTKMDGGSFGHDPYPDGYHVYAKKLNKDNSFNDKGVQIDFYQSGCFNAMIKPDEVILVKDVEFELKTEVVVKPKKMKMK